MEKEIFISECERIYKKYGTRLWIAESLGRRWSYLTGWGEERFLPPKLIGKIENYGIFIEGEDHEEEIRDDVGKILSRFSDVQES